MFRNKYFTLAQLLRNERRSAEKLVEIQNRKLRRLVHHAYERVAFYRARFDRVGIKPEDIRTVDDLHFLPVVTKQDIISQTDGQVLDTTVSESSLVERRTSGSSGEPFQFFVDKDYDRFCKAQYLRPYVSNGRGLFDTAMRFSSTSPRNGKWFQRLGILREFHVQSSLRGVEMLATYRSVNPDVLIGYPSAILTLAEALIATGTRSHLPRIVFTDSELLTDFARDRIREAFGAPIIDVYGTFETDNIAWQCGDRSAYHYAADCVILETLQDGQVVAPDMPGELVCTVLNSMTMPFIRYNVGDVVTLSSRQCSCGRTLPLISAIEGRAIDRMTLPDGSRVSALQVLHAFKQLSDILLEYQVVQESIDEFTVTVSPRHSLTSADNERITNAVRVNHPQARVSVRPVILDRPRPPGKQRIFVSRI